MKFGKILSSTLIRLIGLAAITSPPEALADTMPAAASVEALIKGGVVTNPPQIRTLSLAECFNRAEIHNKEIVSAAWNVPLAGAAIKSAGALPNPQFQLLEGWGQYWSLSFGANNPQAQFNQVILTGGKRTKNINLARANYGLAQLQLEALKFDVHNRVRRAYAEQAAAEAYAELIESERAVGEKLLVIAQKRFNAGKAPQSEVLQAQLNVSQFDVQRNQARVRLQQDSTALGLLIGEIPEHLEIIDVEDNVLFKLSAKKSDIAPMPVRDVPAMEQLTATAFMCRPDLKAAEQQVFVSRKALLLARSKRVPNLNVGFGYQWFQEGKYQTPESPYVPPSLGEGVYFTLNAESPIFYQYQGEIQKASASLRKSERQVDLSRCLVATDVATAYNEVIVARANIFVFQNDLLSTAANVSRVARRGYEVGKTDLATAIVAQQQYQQVLSSYFDAVVAYQTAWADLEKAVGVSLRL